uniref:amino acid ABC transporter substrate-binding protein n=1 Tax=Alistipes sp. TaxID=1872444 RepID=UPI004056FEDE
MRRLFSTLLLLFLMLTELQAGPIERSRTIVYIRGEKYYIHTVAQGDTLAAIAQAYECSEEAVLELNPQAKDGLKADQTLRIKVKKGERTTPARGNQRRAKQEFTIHRITAGETLYAISRRYEISVERLLEDNPEIDPIHLVVGSEIKIRRGAIGRTTEESSQAEMERYAEALNSVQEDEAYLYYVVKPKETIYSLARRFGISEEEFIALNNLEGGLKAGAIVRIPKQERVEERASQEVDSLPYASPTDTLRVEERRPKPELFFSALSPYERLQVALLLPMSNKAGSANSNYAAFYQGFLLGLEELKGAGRSVDLALFDTQRDSSRLQEILLKEEFKRAQLIIGPIYEEELVAVIPYAEAEGIPVVSPLASYSGVDSDVLFQMAPDVRHKYDKLAELLTPERAITLIRTPEIDREFEAEILSALQGRSYTYYDYVTVQGVENAERGDLTPLLTSHEDHLFAILSKSEVEVDRILASLSSAQNNLVARSLSAPTYQVLGSTRWNRFTNIDRTILFKNRVILFSLFHAKRDNAAVRAFDHRYLKAFSSLPNLYAYRGYEAAMIFCEGLFSEIEYKMEGRRYRPLQSPYTFLREEGRLSHDNQEWVRMQYNLDFTITIE